MASDALIGLLPDLVLVMRRDGHIVAYGGGHGVSALRPFENETAQAIEAAWSDATGKLIAQLVRRCISQRTMVDARFRELDRHYEARATAQGPDRAVVTVRALLAETTDDSPETSGERPRPELDRRGFLRRLKESVSLAVIQEKSLAVGVLYIDGILDIGQIMAARVSEQILNAAILRLSAHAGFGLDGLPGWYLGQIGESALALVVDSSDRAAVEACVSKICTDLREPVTIGDSEFRLTVYAGVGMLGHDASSPRLLLDHARAAAAEAKRAASAKVHFFSDTMQLRSLARMDMARELREAIASGAIGVRYTARHDLRTGRAVTWVAYLRWEHPLRGEIRPAEFLRVAESTGLAITLSRAALNSVCADFARLGAQWEPGVRVSFGALRDHVFHEGFLGEIERLLAEGRIPPERFELRVAEKAFVVCDPTAFGALSKSGVRLVVDEVGRDMGSLVALARAPLWGLQLDRSWTTAIRSDDVARSVCRAGLSVANALNLAPIATGVDSEAQREALLELGFRYGTGDLYSASPQNISTLAPAARPSATPA